MADTANDLTPGDEVDGHEVATVARTGTKVRVTFTDKRFNPRVLERWEPVPETVSAESDDVEVVDEDEDEDEPDEE